MVGSHAMTSHDIEANRTNSNTIGTGSYGADSPVVQRIVHNGIVRNEGNPNDFTPGHNVYEIWSAIPRDHAETGRVQEPAGDLLRLGLAHGGCLDPDGARLHDSERRRRHRRRALCRSGP